MAAADGWCVVVRDRVERATRDGQLLASRSVAVVGHRLVVEAIPAETPGIVDGQRVRDTGGIGVDDRGDRRQRLLGDDHPPLQLLKLGACGVFLDGDVDAAGAGGCGDRPGPWLSERDVVAPGTARVRDDEVDSVDRDRRVLSGIAKCSDNRAAAVVGDQLDDLARSARDGTAEAQCTGEGDRPARDDLV